MRKLPKNSYGWIAVDYAKRVVAGKVDACWQVKAACQRTLDDLQRDDLDLDLVRVDHVCNFIQALCHVIGPLSGQPIKLEPFQVFILASLFGFVVKATGLRKYREAFILLPRGNAKSTLAAAIALYMTFCEGQGGAEGYSGATSLDQANAVFLPAKAMVEMTPALADALGLEVAARSIYQPHTHSNFRPVRAQTKDGGLPWIAICDELHQAINNVQIEAFRKGMGKRRGSDPMLLIISTAGTNFAGVCRQEQLYFEGVLSSSIKDDAKFALIYTIDNSRTNLILRNQDAFSYLVRRCLENNVSTAAIRKSISRASAALAMSGIIEPICAEGDAQTIPTGPSGHAACAEPVTSGCGWKKTPSSSSAPAKAAASGSAEILKSVRQRLPSGKPSRNQRSKCEISGLETTTVSAWTIIEPFIKLAMADVTSAASNRNHLSLITATIAGAFEGYSVNCATAESASSEIGRALCSALTDIWPDSLKWTDDFLTVEIPADDWRDFRCWKKANPNYGVSVDEDHLRREYEKALQSPAAQADCLTKYLNVWVATATGWINQNDWANARADDLDFEALKGRPAGIGVDLSTMMDLTAVVATVVRDDGVRVLFPFLWVPSGSIDRSKNKQAYAQWIDTGDLIGSEGTGIDLAEIQAKIEALCAHFAVSAIYFDPRDAQQMQQDLLKKGLPVVTFGQNAMNYTPVMAQFEVDLASGKLLHSGNYALDWCAANLSVRPDANSNILPRKPDGQDHLKIDGIVAALMAHAASQQAAPAPAAPMLSFI